LAEGGEGLSDDGRAVGNDLISKLSTYLDATNQPNVPQVIEAAVEASDAEDVDNDNWHISLRFNHVVLRNGMDPLSFFRYLGTIGEIVQIITHYDAIPVAAQMDPEDCYLYYDIN
jgi:two-component system chemotaxis sensor kinase CheA